jgi:hypothetical protein
VSRPLDDHRLQPARQQPGPNSGAFFVTQSSRSATDDREKTENARAVLMNLFARCRHRPGVVIDRAAAHSRHRHDGGLNSGSGHRRRRSRNSTP